MKRAMEIIMERSETFFRAIVTPKMGADEELFCCCSFPLAAAELEESSVVDPKLRNAMAFGGSITTLREASMIAVSTTMLYFMAKRFGSCDTSV